MTVNIQLHCGPSRCGPEAVVAGLLFALSRDDTAVTCVVQPASPALSVLQELGMEVRLNTTQQQQLLYDHRFTVRQLDADKREGDKEQDEEEDCPSAQELELARAYGLEDYFTSASSTTTVSLSASKTKTTSTTMATSSSSSSEPSSTSSCAFPFLVVLVTTEEHCQDLVSLLSQQSNIKRSIFILEEGRSTLGLYVWLSSATTQEQQSDAGVKAAGLRFVGRLSMSPRKISSNTPAELSRYLREMATRHEVSGDAGRLVPRFLLPMLQFAVSLQAEEVLQQMRDYEVEEAQHHQAVTDVRAAIESGTIEKRLDRLIAASRRYASVLGGSSEDILTVISRQRLQDVADSKAETSLEALQSQLETAPPCIDFLERLRKGQPMAVMAEVKRASPSRGDIALDIVASEQALRYAQGGASAISVLTEPTWFKGSLQDMHSVRLALEKMPNRPAVLRKDFILEEYQVKKNTAEEQEQEPKNKKKQKKNKNKSKDKDKDKNKQEATRQREKRDTLY